MRNVQFVCMSEGHWCADPKRRIKRCRCEALLEMLAGLFVGHLCMITTVINDFIPYFLEGY